VVEGVADVCWLSVTCRNKTHLLPGPRLCLVVRARRNGNNGNGNNYMTHESGP